MSRLKIFSNKTMPYMKNLLKLRSTWNITYRGMAAKQDCWMPVCGVLIRKVPIEDSREKCRINTFLMKNLFQDDPLMIAAGVHKNDPDPGLIQFYASTINEGKSLYAMIDMTREIIGVAVARHTNHNTAHELQHLAKQLTYDETGRYMQTLAVVEERANVYRAYNANKAWSIECLCTGRKFRRRGIAKLLMKTSKELALQDKQTNIMKFTCTNAYGGRAALACGGMKLHTAKAPTEYRDEKGNTIISNSLCPPHKNIELFVGDVKRDV